MNTVERIKKLCKDRKIPVSRLERDLGFANGYIGQLKKGTVPNDRLVKIANYLEVSEQYLNTGEESEEHSVQLNGHKEGYYINEETAQIAQEIFEDKDLRALFDAGRNASPRDLQIAADLLWKLKATNPDG